MKVVSATTVRDLICGKVIGAMLEVAMSSLTSPSQGKAAKQRSSRQGRFDKSSLTWLNVQPLKMVNSNRSDAKVDGMANFVGRRHLVRRNFRT